MFGKLTGGRPMKYEGFAFTDAVSGKRVEYRRDTFGRLWMADGGAWSMFRVKAREPFIKTYDAERHADFHAGFGQ